MNKNSHIGSFQLGEGSEFDELNLTLCQTQQSLLFRKKALLIKDEIQK